MAAITVDAPPFNPVVPFIQVGTDPDTVNIECAASELEVSPEQDETTTETFCVRTRRTRAKLWTITANRLSLVWRGRGSGTRSVRSSDRRSRSRSARRVTIPSRRRTRP